MLKKFNIILGLITVISIYTGIYIKDFTNIDTRIFIIIYLLSIGVAFLMIMEFYETSYIPFFVWGFVIKFYDNVGRNLTGFIIVFTIGFILAIVTKIIEIYTIKEFEKQEENAKG